MAHTPGPWTAEWVLGSKCFAIRSGDGTLAYTRQRVSKHISALAMHHANAALIASSPDLLEALEEARLCILSQHRPGKAPAIIAKLDAAIASAKGEA